MTYIRDVKDASGIRFEEQYRLVGYDVEEQGNYRKHEYVIASGPFRDARVVIYVPLDVTPRDVLRFLLDIPEEDYEVHVRRGGARSRVSGGMI